MSGKAKDEAFVAFVGAHAARLVRTAELLCGDRGRAGDLVRTAWERAYARWHRIEDD